MCKTPYFMMKECICPIVDNINSRRRKYNRFPASNGGARMRWERGGDFAAPLDLSRAERRPRDILFCRLRRFDMGLQALVRNDHAVCGRVTVGHAEGFHEYSRYSGVLPPEHAAHAPLATFRKIFLAASNGGEGDLVEFPPHAFSARKRPGGTPKRSLKRLAKWYMSR